MNPIAVYKTRHSFARQRIELYEDSIRAQGSRNHLDFDVTLPLVRIDSGFERIWLYNFLFYIGFWLVISVLVLLLIVVTLVEMLDYKGSLSRGFGLVGSVGAAGFALALLNCRKVEFVQFRTDAGRPVLAIPRDRRRSREFDQFIDLLVERIHIVRGEYIPPEAVPGEF
jgi:hypothetical protein